MTCKVCNTRNPIGNKFCRECGSKLIIPEGSLAAEEAARAENERRTERAAVLLTDAQLLTEQGKYLGAIPIVEEVLQLLPQSTSAYVLLVSLYEHTDQIEKAVVAQERVVALNPDSPADVIRLEKLRKGERTSSLLSRTPEGNGTVPTLRSTPLPTSAGGAYASPFPSWFPLVAAVVGGGFVVFLGFLTVMPMNPGNGRSTVKDNSVAIATPAPSASPTPAPIAYNPNATYPIAPPGTDPFNRSNVDLNKTRQTLQAEAARQDGTLKGAIAPSASSTGSGLPSPRTIHAPRTEPRPFTFEINKPSAPTDNSNSPLAPINAGPPTAGNNSDAAEPPATSERIAAGPPTDATGAPSRTSYMRISVGPPSNSKPTPIAVSAPTSSDNNSDMDADPMRRARTLQSMGRYRDAVGAYREAIAGGASAGEAQQGIGLCYQRLGDNDGAKSAYRQAVASYEAQIASGRNVNAAQRGINSSKTALEVLGE